MRSVGAGAGLEDEMTNGHGEPLAHEPREPWLEPARGPLAVSGDDDFIRREGGARVLDGLEGVRLGDLARNVEVVADAVEGRLQADARLVQGTVDSACQTACGGDERRRE